MVNQGVLVNYKPFLKLVKYFRLGKYERSVFVFQWEQERARQGLVGAVVFEPDPAGLIEVCLE